MVVGGYSQRLLCLNPTTDLAVLLLGLWLLLGYDNSYNKGIVLKNSKSHVRIEGNTDNESCSTT